MTGTSGRAYANETMKEDERKRETKYETKDWRWLLWDSDLARDRIQPELGAGWTAVLKEACCVKAGAHKDKVKRLRKDVKEPLRLWRVTTHLITSRAWW